MDLYGLYRSLNKDWGGLGAIIQRYAPIINEQMDREMERFEGAFCIFPPQDKILAAFDHFDEKDLKVVIIGQDAYINEGEAMGLCFSVPQDAQKCPPSLRNVFKELAAEYDGKMRTNTDLTDWATQGVLLLNRALTVREGASMSHMKIWKDLTEDIIKHIATKNKNVVYILWGQQAQSVLPFINAQENRVLLWSHPSPLSRKPFIGNGHFRKCNEYLESVGKEPIIWL